MTTQDVSEAPVGYTLSVAHRIATVLLCILLAAAFSLHHSLNKLSDLITYRLEQRPMQTLTQEVTNASGKKVIVTTTKKDTETVTEFVNRHNTTVAAVEASG